MLLDFEVQRSTRRCAATDRELAPGEVCYSVLEVQGADLVRKDYCREAWHGPPDEAFGWWKSSVPEASTKKTKLAPNEVLLQLFDELAERPEQQDLRYVLALLLIRRRVFRLDVSETLVGQPAWHETGCGLEAMVVYCAKRDATYQVAVTMPDSARMNEIQQQLSELLVTGTN